MFQEKQLTSLMQDLEALSSYKRAEAVKQIGKLRIALVDLPLTLHSKLEKALADPSPEVRAEAAMTIAFLEGKIAVPLLVPLLKDPVDNVRSNVISALSYTNTPMDEKLSDMLINCLQDSNVQIRDRCARALGRLQIKNAEDILVKCLEHDSSPVVRTGAAVGLGKLEKLSPNLLEALHSISQTETSPLVKHVIEETITYHLSTPKA